jgi:nucleotide-binding universal stress UspA family protein
MGHALELAEAHGATVHALYVIDTGTGWLTVSKADVSSALREAGETAGKRALSAADALASEHGVEVVTALREGTPHEEILAYVEESGDREGESGTGKTDLVVMGTHGREGVTRRLLGSVTERVVRGSPVPVVTLTA